MKKQFLLLAALLVIGIAAPAGASAQDNKSFNKPRGYMRLVDIDFGGSISGDKLTPVSATMVNGYRFMPQLAIGLGTGVQMVGENSVLPVFLHLRSDILDNWVSPFVAVNIGHNFGLSTKFYTGFMVEPSMGVGFNAGPKGRLNVGAFCAMNNVRIYDSPSQTGHYTGAVYCAMGLKIGMSF